MGEHEVIVARDGNEGLDKLTKDKPTVVVTDVNLPGISGIELIDWIKLNEIPCKIIAVSSSSKRDDFLPVAEKLGAHATLEKPFNLSNFQSKIAMLLP